MKKKLPLMMIGVILIISNQVHATTINYDLANLGGNQWEYTYTVINDTFGSDINEFSVYFSYGLYGNLAVTSPLAGWDELATNPALILGSPFDGFYDALALVSGITPGSSLGGFSVSFDWLGTGMPGLQSFEVIDPDTFAALDSGNTASSVPEPATLILLGSGLFGLATLRKGRRITGSPTSASTCSGDSDRAGHARHTL